MIKHHALIKPSALIAALALIAGCTTIDQKEARCKCFKSDGAPTGHCDFTRLPPDRATYSFAATRLSTTAAQAGNAAARPALSPFSTPLIAALAGASCHAGS